MDASIPPTLQFHLAKAYGVRATPSSRVDSARPAATTARVDGPVARPAPVRVDTPGIRALVAGTVPGKAEFSGSIQPKAPGAYTMYGRPADANAAATGVSLGRAIDAKG